MPLGPPSIPRTGTHLRESLPRSDFVFLPHKTVSVPWSRALLAGPEHTAELYLEVSHHTVRLA